nr:reverse transcriptase domain-containing protein [Tanacetum cinerariifolium]
MGRSCPKNNNTHKSMQPRPAIHRVDRFPTVDLKLSTAARRVKTATPRPNMNSTRPQTTQDLMIILIRRVQRLERELKERTLIHKVDRGRSSPLVSTMHCVPKKGGFKVVENEDNELILTRLVTRWRVCIDYPKLNEATQKDDFPLSFMD